MLVVRDGGRRCLSCRDGDPLVVHVLPKADDLRVSINHCSAIYPLYPDLNEEYATARLLGFNSLEHIDNRVLLCSNCHRKFDSNRTPPGWVLLPSDLDYFINWEEYETANSVSDVVTWAEHVSIRYHESSQLPLVRPRHLII